MTIERLGLWTFQPALTEGDEIECPTCKVWVSHRDWIDSEVGCEDCGEHAAMECPSCHERHDHVWGPTFNTRATR